jgi:Tol biopolymer transport system component
LNEELVYNFAGTGLFFYPQLLFPGGDDLLAATSRDYSNLGFYRINLTSHQAVDLGEVPGFYTDVAWDDPGKTILFSRTVNGLTNIWKYSLKDRSLTQITFGTGPDYSPMPDPGGKGTYYVNGKSSGFLTAYHVHSKVSTDIASENATQPLISRDGKRVMYVTLPHGRNDLWVSDIDGNNKAKIATGETLGTGAWAPDSFHLSFVDEETGAGTKSFVVGADGSGLRQTPPVAGTPNNAVWSPDQKTVYVSAFGKTDSNVWIWKLDGLNPEKLVDNCGYASDVDPSGKYLLTVERYGEKTGIYEISISDRKCIPLIPGAVTESAFFARDGKSLLYAVGSRGEVTIFRQPWKDGKSNGAALVGFKVPFTFPLDYLGNAYDFSRDLSTIVYARPSGHADLYLLSQR